MTAREIYAEEGTLPLATFNLPLKTAHAARCSAVDTTVSLKAAHRTRIHMSSSLCATCCHLGLTTATRPCESQRYVMVGA